ncbi:hypothetical protein N7537_000497 [Penicillium hordei]|uniref:Uncharacterized protein n=1 Tax=Penicillium hordei TaxID=40994 RepID=A0AAD6EE18_9EURO|nr:uncharacterized protein N7537_000497 [Penicillium hordei]KAJ5615383.1 hypothetical protein N7537_000497 [Penicillium hordei]
MPPTTLTKKSNADETDVIQSKDGHWRETWKMLKEEDIFRLDMGLGLGMSRTVSKVVAAE